MKKSVKLNKDLLNHKAGDVVEILCDENGIPLEKFWRDRFADSKRDNCVEWAGKKSEEKKAEVKSEDKKPEEKAKKSEETKKEAKKGEGDKK